MNLKLTEYSRYRARASSVVATIGFAILALSSQPIRALDVGSSAPAFSLTSNRGKLDSASLKGKLAYVDFWASWCVPCKQSFPWMNEMQAKYGDRGLHVLAINVDASPLFILLAPSPKTQPSRSIALGRKPSPTRCASSPE